MTAGTSPSTPTSGWSSTARRPPAGRGAASPSSSDSPRRAACAGCAPCSSTSIRRARSSRRRRGNHRSRRKPRGPAVRRRRLCRGALPRAGLAQGRAAAARLRLRPRAQQVPAVPHPRRRGRREPAPPAPLSRELPLGLPARAPARQVRPRLARPRRARRGRGQLLAASLEYRATLAALARDPGLALAYPGSRRYRTPANLVAAGLIAPIPWAGRPSLLARLAGWSRRRAVACA